MTLPPQDIFAAIRRHHGHYCPMSTLGGRMGWAARHRLATLGTGEGFSAVLFARTCALDGVSCTTGCTEAAGTLTVNGTGEHRLDLGNATAGVSVVLTVEALQIAWRYRQANDAFEKDRAQLATDELQRREAELQLLLDEVLVELRTRPDSELLVITDLNDNNGRS